MKSIGQGVRRTGSLSTLFIRFAFIVMLCQSHPVLAENAAKSKYKVTIAYSKSSSQQTTIATLLSKTLSNDNIDVSMHSEKNNKVINKENKTKLIIAIGEKNIESANTTHPKINKLFISIAPKKNKLSLNPEIKTAFLYMTQSYCRQFHFIKLLNKKWRVIGLLNNHNKFINNDEFTHCADNYNLDTYTVNIDDNYQLRDKVIKVLNHADVLLATPDKHIYNSKSVKNILLTSYRHRKPVIAFSRNFVNAGALASIYSNPEQISKSATTLVLNYFKNKMTFERAEYYPLEFEISINRQVFMALDISIPNSSQLEQIIKQIENNTSGATQ